MHHLAEFAGPWQGVSTLHLPDAAPDCSASALHIAPVLDGRFVRLGYTWAYNGTPQQGSLLIGPDAACWIDTWHMSDKMMICANRSQDGAHFSCRGSYAGRARQTSHGHDEHLAGGRA